MPHIFISYSHKDSDYAHLLAESLKANGLEAWIDDRIDYGETWPDVIEEKLDGCSALIVVMTPAAHKSKWVKNELSRAQRKGKPVFPILLEGDAWLSVEATQYVDVSNGALPPTRFYTRLANVVHTETDLFAIEKPIHLELILIPAGSFLMGSDFQDMGTDFQSMGIDFHSKEEEGVFKEWEQWERPQHRIYLPAYYIAKTPVTNAQWAKFMRRFKIPAGKEAHPVVEVGYNDAYKFCQWLAAQTGYDFRLPTEAEWEKAARGTDGRLWPWGNEPPTERNERCNYAHDEADFETTPVGLYPKGASPYGVLDMAGNVKELCSSLVRRYPYNAEDGRENLNLIDDEEGRTVRGGSYFSAMSRVRCAARDFASPDDEECGFRVACSSSAASGL